MAEETDKKIKEKDIVGLKYFDQLGELLQQLHEVGCERDRAGNRTLPTKINVTPTAGGEHDERAVMDRMIESDRTYVMDRGYAKFELFNRIVDLGSSYVCRIRDNSVCNILEQKPLTDADRAARVLSDPLISLGSDNSKGKPNHPVRLVVIEAKPHKSKGKPGTGSTGQNCDGFLRSATNLLDVPAEIIALLSLPMDD